MSKFAILVPLTLAVIALPALAHEGHGAAEGAGHWLLDHGAAAWLLAPVALAVLLRARRRRAR